MGKEKTKKGTELSDEEKAKGMLAKTSREYTQEEQIFHVYQLLNHSILERLKYEQMRRMGEDELAKARTKAKIDNASGNLTNINQICESIDRDIRIFREMLEELKGGKLKI